MSDYKLYKESNLDESEEDDLETVMDDIFFFEHLHMSDVVFICGKYYYCNLCGWVELKEKEVA